MRTFLALTYREIAAYFVSPVAYIVIFVFLCASGLGLWENVYELVYSYKVPVQWMWVFGWPVIISMLIAPFITMRLLAEEKNRGTLERLMTAPLSDWTVVLSKFFSAVSFYVMMLAPTVLFAVYLGMFTSLDRGELIGSYLGLILMTATMISIGLFISSMCGNQMSAGIISFALALFLIFTNQFIKPAIPMGSVWEDVVKYVNLMQHTEHFAKGVIDTKDVVFYLSVSVLFLFWTVRVVESRRWK